jgi:flagellar motor switch protein FliN/FliY
MTILEEVRHLSDIPIHVDAELDRKVMTVRDILALEIGSVIKLTRSAGENIVLLMGGTPVGSGEIVVVDEAVGVRITDFREED